ncbi:hypothetical protein [Roseateles sp.]|uniref:hypothetical protein n=1 Tax=Roseateles sp. TaxID=1971397 RepID=UPI002F3FF2BE
MSPHEIAMHLTRPMSDEEADRMILARYGAREMADLDLITLAEINESVARIEREEARRRELGSA